jgi:tetratricopeptide (TPR) repeat protein
MELGMECIRQGQYDEAVAEFEKAIELDPGRADAYRNMGTIYGEQDALAEAVAAYEKAIEIDPDFGEAYCDLAGVYVDLEKLAEAIATGEKGIELAPDYCIGRNNLGFAYHMQGMYKEAIAQYQEAIRIDPNSVKAHDNLGMAYYEQGRFDEAVAEWEESLRINPDSAIAHNNLGLVHYNQGRLDEAVIEWEETIMLDPDGAQARINLGLVYSDLGRTEEAIAAFEAYLRLRPDAPNRAAVEEEIVKLQGAAGQEAEYSNAEGGYGLLYPDGWYYTESGTQAEFAESEEALDTAGDENPGVMFNAGPLDKLAESLGLTDTTDPVVVWEAMAESLGVEGDEMESFNLAGSPAAAADISGAASGVSFEGAMVIILVEERIVYAIALSPPDQWEDFRSLFVDMVNSLTFFEP